MEENGNINLLDCGIIKNKSDLPHSECLRRLAGGIRELVQTFHPDAASIESAFVSKNIKTAMILSIARGAVITALAECGIPIYEYSPKSAKRAITGIGSADKQQLASILSIMCKLNVSQIPDDSTDALALAYCHGNILFHSKTGSVLPPKPI